jgi:solute carrier family 25 carnitine/acylcarnitine transporter 20/29
LAGLGNGFVSGPVEHIRIRASFPVRDLRFTKALPSSGLQIQSNTNPVYRGPFDAVKKIGSKYGIRGIYKGQGVTFLREAIGYSAYFWTYEKLVQREMALKNIRREQISPGSAVLYGAAAGYAVSILSW